MKFNSRIYTLKKIGMRGGWNGDGVAKYTKLRPMWVEMFLHVQTKTCVELKSCITCKNIAAGSGETTKSKIILAVLKKLKIESWKLKVMNFNLWQHLTVSKE